MNTRQQFENWYSGDGKYPGDVARDERGEYKFGGARTAWRVWEVAAEKERSECAGICDKKEADAHNKGDGWQDIGNMAGECADAIRERSNA